MILNILLSYLIYIYIYYIATRHLTEVLKILSKKFLMGFSKQFNECSSTIFLANFILIGAEFKFWIISVNLVITDAIHLWLISVWLGLISNVLCFIDVARIQMGVSRASRACMQFGVYHFFSAKVSNQCYFFIFMYCSKLSTVYL